MEESVSVTEEGDGGRNAVNSTEVDKGTFQKFRFHLVSIVYAIMMAGNETSYVYCILRGKGGEKGVYFRPPFPRAPGFLFARRRLSL